MIRLQEYLEWEESMVVPDSNLYKGTYKFKNRQSFLKIQCGIGRKRMQYRVEPHCEFAAGNACFVMSHL